ncbi:M48 family metallopeptidase [Kitasatospora sp. DSM 101779]|uniref:M48 family metallopeptidase n=1 Tax=Kitasatospora sp. DSM 101779 TaxID=2853165 RepID=UPI0021D9A2FB|nr:M48 family metallopeptidase [Kitasatospora sp. DSM 101779]MCU7823557.1 M48 family metalloprotease [Kitasatospora sp. DSM 101779]
MRTAPRPADGPALLPPGGIGFLARGLLALALLAGFYLLALGIVGGLLAVDVLLAVNSAHPFGLGGLKVYAVSAVLAYPVLRTVFLTHRHKPAPEPLPGLSVGPAEQPVLWERVRQLADEYGTRAPDELRLVAEANAQVCEDVRLLGLLPGRRRMELGIPLLIGFNQAELDAVIAHELGHFGNKDTRIGGLTHSGRRAVAHTVHALHERAARNRAAHAAELAASAAVRRAKGRRTRTPQASGGVDQVLARIFAAYAGLYLTVSAAVSRRQEIAADLAAVRLVGRDATASALRRLPVIDTALEYHLHRYAMVGWEDGLLPLPGQVYGGLAHLLAEPGRREELGRLEPEAADAEHDPYDSHPPLPARIAAVESLPPDGRATTGSGPALALLSAPERTVAEVEAVTLPPESAGMTRLDWPELARRTGRARHAAGVDALRQAVGRDLPAAALLAEVMTGHLREIADRLPKSPQARAATGRAAREFTRPVLRSALSDLVLIVLADAGTADWDVSWAEPVRLRLPDAVARGLPAALDAAVADVPDRQPLRTLLADAGLPLPPAPC